MEIRIKRWGRHAAQASQTSGLQGFEGKLRGTGLLHVFSFREVICTRRPLGVMSWNLGGDMRGNK